MEEKYKKIIFIIFLILIGIILSVIIIDIIQNLSNPPQYYIQDTYNWCCKHLNETFTPYGDNCSNVINNIYNGC
jgi:regulatory protein YycI of two-component signal transduction system YycFG